MADHQQGSGPRRDNLFARPLGTVGGFVFDSAVVDVFPDMIKRSVPGYDTIIAMTGTLADRFVRPDTRCYDLGCSLGASLLSVAAATSDRPRDLIGIDNSAAMIDQCRQILIREPAAAATTLICDAIQNIPLHNASLVVLNFTLQFIPVAERQALLAAIYRGLNPGGILVLSEKVVFEDQHHNELMIDLYHNFKRANGYSDLEISQKRTALENVLIPETLHTHRERLKTVGFDSVDVWFQCFNFASMLAIRQ